MQDIQKRSVSEKANTCLQNIAIILAGIWALSTYYNDHYAMPATSPANVTVSVQLRSLGVVKKAVSKYSNEPFHAVEMTVSATNPNSRELDLLPSAWLAVGKKIMPADRGGDNAFADGANKILAAPPNQFNYFDYSERYYQTTSPVVIATGRIFEDTFLKPNEKIERTIVFFVPVSEKIDMVEVKAVVPCTTKSSNANAVWKLQMSGIDKKPDLLLDLYINEKGQKKKVERDANGRYPECIGLQKSAAIRGLLLSKSY